MLGEGSTTTIDDIGALRRRNAELEALLAQQASVEKALSRSEANLRALLAAMTDVVVVLDADGRCVEIAPTNPSSSSRPVATALGRTVHEMLPPPEGDALLACVRQTLATGRATPFECSRPIDGATGYLAGTLSALSADTVLLVARDVTVEKLRQQALRASEEHFRRLIEISPLPMAVVSAQGVGLYVNARFTELLGYALEDVPTLEAWWPKVFPEASYRASARAVGMHRLAEAARHGTGMRPVEAVVSCKDGSSRCIEFHTAPVDYNTLAILVDLTERRRTQAALRESEERYRRFVHMSAEGVWRFTATVPIAISLEEHEQAELMLQRGWLAECNDAYARQHGFEHAVEMVGRRMEEIMLGTREEKLATLLRFVRSRYSIIDLESTGVDREGKGRFYLNNIVGIIDNGLLQWGWGTQRDITARKQAEQALRRSEERNRRLVEGSPLSMAVVGDQGAALYFNPKFTEIFGYTMDDMPTIWVWWQKAFPDHAYRKQVKAQWVHRLAEAAHKGTGVPPMEAVVTCKDGSTRHIESHAMPMEGQMLTIHVDLTERRRAEAALRKSEESYRRFVQVTAEGVWRQETAVPIALDGGECAQAELILDNSRLTECNDAYARQHGFERAAAMLGRRLDDIMHGTREQKLAVIRQFIRSGYRLDFEEMQVDRAGNVRWYLNNVVGILDDRGFVAGWGTQRDITARKQGEELMRRAHGELEQRVAERTAELSAANERLRELDRLKSQFLAMMSHELRTPLNSIIGFTGILRQGFAGPVNQEQKKQLDITYQSALHLLSLINDLLDLSRIEAGKMTPERWPFDFAGVVAEVVQSVAAIACRKGIKLCAEPPCPSILMIGDRKRCLQVLLNLVDNAVKFTQKGEVRITARADHAVLRASVTDTGIGIRQEQMGMLFEAFRQLDGSAKRIYEGTGLGLYLCRKLLTLMGGEIGVESEFGKGSRFSFALPLELATPTHVTGGGGS